MRGKCVAASATETAFSCPHCGTLAPQQWYDIFGKATSEAPNIWDEERLANFKTEKRNDLTLGDEFWQFFERLAVGYPMAHKHSTDQYVNHQIYNVFVSVCGQCDEAALWLADRMLWPSQNEAPSANADLPADIVKDYIEAGGIVAQSPRGAAALLRLCVQKLCKFVLQHESGKTIDADIKTLVAKGLDVRIQRALDIVRVVGNESVHPGTMDISDNRATAEELFRLVNLIAEVLITQPRQIEEMYATLPPEKIRGIEERDAPKQISSPKKQ